MPLWHADDKSFPFSSSETDKSQPPVNSIRASRAVLLLRRSAAGFIVFSRLFLFLLTDDRPDDASFRQAKRAALVVPAVIELHLLNAFLTGENIAGTEKPPGPFQTLINRHDLNSRISADPSQMENRMRTMNKLLTCVSARMLQDSETPDCQQPNSSG